MEALRIFEGLNDEQRRAVAAVRGPVCILAGAGSGKTTTITRRIANQVATGAFDAGEILAVTFTDKAAGEMRHRLSALGVEGSRASTFHAAALGQLRHLGADPPAEILPSKVMPLRQIANSLPKPYRFRPAADLATEIEWAKNRRISPDGYVAALGSHQPPVPPDLMAGVYKRYEAGKRQRNLIDFEDVLELAIQLFRQDEWAREQMWSRYRAFTVDEYQDVNLLQQTLLNEWLGSRDDLCVVGDDYQSIYGFTGATSAHLLEMPRRFPRTSIIRLERNYRSTPQVLEVANRLVPRLGGAEKVLRPVRDAGPAAIFQELGSPAAEQSFLVGQIASLHQAGLAYEQMAILYRLNFRSEDYEEALAAASIPYQVRDGAFLTRQSARQIVTSLRRSSSTEVAAHVRALAGRAGYLEDLPEGIGEQELTRQNDLSRLIRLAEEFDDGARNCKAFAEDLETRFGAAGGRGVNLLTLHRSKGLEFEAVFLPRVEAGELPFKRARSPEAVAEERRLFYVGITRAKSQLALTWVRDGKRRPSSFVDEIRIDAASLRDLPTSTRSESVAKAPDSDLVTALKEWRARRARTAGVPAFVVLHDSTLHEIAARKCRTTPELAEVAGIGPVKLEQYGGEITGVVGAVVGKD